MDARQIIDYAADDNAKDFRESLYASIYDKITDHLENMKQQVAQRLVTQEEKDCVSKSDAKDIAKKEAEKETDEHEDEKHGKKGDVAKHEKEMHKEDVEQIDELSIQTMKSAKDKLAGKAIAAHYDDNKVAARNLANRALKIGKKVDRKEWQQTNQKRLDQTAKYQKEDIEEIEEAVTRKHFQMVADLIKSHEDPAKRKELAQHHAEIFKQQNPRFDHAKFMKAAGASE